MRGNVNSSFYDIVSNLLSANNFDFIPLPSYIPYNEVSTMEQVFKPLDISTTPSCEPSFVCMYIGQRSKHLDFNNSSYGNDSFDVSETTFTNIPNDFLTKNDTNGRDNQNIVFFDVSFSKQNQSFFKSINLDQSQFTETAESLQITDDISKKGIETNKTLAGQNMFNVYSMRSYRAEIEMLGNAMIQPMMYFQLSNIPMFHGAYTIIRTKHSVKPNHMLTTFTGVRLRKAKTPILEKSTYTSGLIDSLNIFKFDMSDYINSSSIPSYDTNFKPSKIGCGVKEIPSYNDSGKHIETKNLRDLVASVESNGDYNITNYYIDKDNVGIKKNEDL
jgi:hypothetical protein